jgi:hypothetical protein
LAQKSVISLSISEAGSPPSSTYQFQVNVNDEPVAGDQILSPEQAKAVRNLSGWYISLFEQIYAGSHLQPKIAKEQQIALGRDLFDLWLAESWDEIEKKVPSSAHRMLVVASDAPDALNLPWEMLRLPKKLHLPDCDFIGFDPRFSVRRLPGADRQLEAFSGSLRPRPLRVLYMASSPIDLAELFFEREEEAFIRAISNAGPEAAFDICDMGSFDELRERINEFQPHVVHLTGHGIVGRRCPKCRGVNGPEDFVCDKCKSSIADVPALGHFAFEDERGISDLRSSFEINGLIAGSDVSCVFVSGCETGKAPSFAALGGVCQGLVAAGVPVAIGWAASIADDIATQLAAEFYKTLAAGQPVDRALLLGRQAIREICDKRADPSWTLPVLYSATDQDKVFDTDPNRQPEFPRRESRALQPLPGMIEGYAEHFVGRRRELQRLLPELRGGKLQTVVITGLGGSGKSTIATRLARKLERDDFIPFAVPSKKGNLLSASKILEACGDVFRQAARKLEAQGDLNMAAELRIADQDLANKEIPVDARLRDIIATLNRGRFLVVLDNLEVNLDESTRRFKDPELAKFYVHLLGNLSGGSRALITSRYLPAEAPELSRTAMMRLKNDTGKKS